MDFSWPAEYLDFKEQVSTFAKETLNQNVIERDAQGIFSIELWKKCAAFGIQKLACPKQFGGKQEKIDILKAVLGMEGLGYGCIDNGLSLALNAQMWTVQLPIVDFGTTEQKERFLRPLASGEWIGSHALTEPEAGSDVFSLKMTADKVENGYILNGKKRLITLAPIANVVLLLAVTNPTLGRWGVSAFLLKTDTPGFKAGPMLHKMGMRTVPIGEFECKDCFVPEENRLGAEGSGFSIMSHSLEYDRCCILASQIGTMERQLEEAIAYAKNRKQFGQPISKFQSVSNRITDMKLRLETSRLLLYKVAWLKSKGKSAMMEAAMLKLHLGESFVTSSLDAIRTHGGIGYLTDTGIERNLRDAVGGVLYAGTSDIQRNIIAALLGL